MQFINGFDVFFALYAYYLLLKGVRSTFLWFAYVFFCPLELFACHGNSDRSVFAACFPSRPYTPTIAMAHRSFMRCVA